jgi:hypothetical protein
MRVTRCSASVPQLRTCFVGTQLNVQFGPIGARKREPELTDCLNRLGKVGEPGVYHQWTFTRKDLPIWDPLHGCSVEDSKHRGSPQGPTTAAKGAPEGIGATESRERKPSRRSANGFELSCVPWPTLTMSKRWAGLESNIQTSWAAEIRLVFEFFEGGQPLECDKRDPTCPGTPAPLHLNGSIQFRLHHRS